MTISLSVFMIQACNETSTDSKESTSKESTTQENTKKKNAFSIPASEVPSSVINTFKSKYPTAENVNWEKATEEGNPSYKAKFQMNDKKIKAEFNEAGSFIKEKEKD